MTTIFEAIQTFFQWISDTFTAIYSFIQTAFSYLVKFFDLLGKAVATIVKLPAVLPWWLYVLITLAVVLMIIRVMVDLL